MRINMAFDKLKKRLSALPNRFAPATDDGSAFMYILVVMLIFGLLGSAVISMYTSAEWMTKAVSNEGRQARSLAESGMRYAVSELRNDGYTRAVISRLNTTTYTIDGAGTFDLNLFGKWFRAAADYNINSGNITLNVPEGQIPEGFAIPQDARVVNLEELRDSIIFAGAANNNDFISKVKPAPDMSTVPLTLRLDNNFIVDQDQKVLLSIRAKADTTVSPGGDLIVDSEAANYFPERNGAFYAESTLDEKTLYYYEEMIDNGSDVTLKNISRDLLVSKDDQIILAERNHRISVTASSGSTAFGGAEELAMDFLQNISTPQVVPPPAMDLPADIPSDEMIPGMATPVESGPDAVDVDVSTGTISLGNNAASTYGAVWFGGTITAGGFDVCTAGVCEFNTGIRSFFIVDYNGTGDGFTFALINAAENDVTATGAGGEKLGYAGLNPGAGTDLKPPKMALEFDTYTNDAARNDPNETGWTNRDVLQFVYWGTDAVDLDDDNYHTVAAEGDNAGLKLKWTFTNPSAAIVSKPAVAADGTIYVSCLDDNLWAINPDGSFNDRFDTCGDVFSSPTIAPDGTVYVGTDGGPTGDIFSLDPATNWTDCNDSSSYNWRVATNSNVRSTPALDSSGNVYFSTWINDGFFYAVDSTGSALTGWPAAKPSASAPHFQADADPAVDVANGAVYFASMYTTDNARLHAFNLDGTEKAWSPIQFAGDSGPLAIGFSSPTVNLINGDPDYGTIYIGNGGDSGEGFLYAFNPNGTQKWRFDFPWTDPVSKPAIGPDGTIYIGNDDNYLYAINPDGTQKWAFQAGGDVRGEPLVGSDGAIYFGSQDANMYAVDTEGRLLGQYALGANISIPDPNAASYTWTSWKYAASPAQGSDGTVYIGATNGDVFAFEPTCFPQNIKSRYFTTEDLPATVQAGLSSTQDWLNSDTNLPWAVRTEVHRSTTVNSRNKYEYTWKMWIRQCGDSSCTDIRNTYFEDVRIDYAAQEPHLVQAAELCAADHTKMDAFLVGFTEGTGGAVQTVDVTEISLGFRRPGDFIITNDPFWP